MGLRFGDCELDLERRELRRGDEPVALEPRAMRVLQELIRQRDRVVSKEELLDTVWGDRFVGESALTTQIKEIRRAVGDTGREQGVVKTVHGQGYMFVAPVDEGTVAEGAVGEQTAVGPVGASGATAHPIVAVLAFENLSPDPGRAHVADGLTSDVITALSKHRWLRVLTRATTSGYAGRPDAVVALRTDFGVRYVVEGAVRLDAGRLRVTASLTDTDTGTCRWSERYDRAAEDLFEVLDEITDVIAATIEPEVGDAERERARRRPHNDLQAWDLHHLGVSHLFRFTAGDNLEAQRLLDRARRLAPDFGEPHAWWAYSVVLGMTYWDTEPNPDLLDQALDATGTALDVDDRDAVFHMIRGRVQLARREYGSALLDNERAIELNRTFAAAYCGLGDSLSYEGRYDEAVSQFRRSVALGERDPQRWAFLSYGALALLFAGRFDEAVEWTERASPLPNCQYWTIAHRVVALELAGRADEARAAVGSLLAQRPGFSVSFARRKLFYLKRPEQIEQYLGGLAGAGVPER